MPQSPHIWQEDFRLRSDEIGLNGSIRLDTLCDYLQESAGAHAREMGVAVDQLLARDMTWVLSRLHLRISRWLQWRDAVRIETWPAQIDRRYAVRDFRLWVDDKPIGVATSAWLLIDVLRKRPMRIPDFLAKMHPDKPVRALQDAFAKIEKIDTAEFESVFSVQYRDLDLNHHANNVSYVSWIEESLPMEFLQTHLPVELEIEFRAESVFGDRIVCQGKMATAGEGHAQYLHLLLRQDDARELARARTSWRKI